MKVANLSGFVMKYFHPMGGFTGWVEVIDF